MHEFSIQIHFVLDSKCTYFYKVLKIRVNSKYHTYMQERKIIVKKHKMGK